MPLVGFSGSRSLPFSFAPVVRSLAVSVLASGRGVAVGDAPGLDLMVRFYCPDAQVFPVIGARSAPALVMRSVSLIHTVARSGSGSGFVSFPARACPIGLMPSPSSSKVFTGYGSGSWASAALAAGLGVPLVVFGVTPPQLPSAWGQWSPAASSGPWAQGWQLAPAQGRLL